MNKDLFSSEGELPDSKNLAAVNASLQHEEKVQRFIESGNMAPHEVALYILSNGSTGQKISMLQHLDRTLRECDEKKITKVITELNEAMWTQDMELQVAAPPALKSILNLLTEEQCMLLLGGVKTMLEVKTEQVRAAWSELALDVVHYITPQVLVDQLVPLALKKGEHSEPHDQRVFGCQLIGRLCRKLDGAVVVRTVLNKAMSLCQDTVTSVRIAMCGQLGEVARAIGLDMTKDRITAELFELLVDEEKLVSRAAFTALIDLVEFFDAPYRREHFYPIIRSYISSPPEEVLSLLIDEFGRFLWKIKTDVQCAEDITLFANFFRQSAQKADPEVRRLCAFNFPAVVASLPLSVFPTHLTQIQRSLSVDQHTPTRRAMAAGLHELCPLLGDKAAFYLKDSYAALIQDPALDVRTVAMRHLSTVLDIFAAQLKGEERDAFFASVVPHICSYEAAVHKDWRKVSALFDGFTGLPRYFSGATIHERFLPLLLTHLVSGAAAIKEQCAALVVLFTKSLGASTLIVETFSKIVSDFGRSTCCFNRMTYCLLFKHCATAYSRRFLRDRLLEALLDLSKDPVANVRLQLVRVLPHVRRCLKPPVDAEHVTAFNSAMARLKADSDSDLQAELQVIAPEMEDVETEYARQAAMRTTNAPDDVKDKEFEAAEGDILEVAKEQEKLERRQKLREMLQRENVGVDARPAAKTTVRGRGVGATSATRTTGVRTTGVAGRGAATTATRSNSLRTGK